MTKERQIIVLSRMLGRFSKPAHMFKNNVHASKSSLSFSSDIWLVLLLIKILKINILTNWEYVDTFNSQLQTMNVDLI